MRASGDVVRISKENQRNEFGIDGLGNVRVVRGASAAAVNVEDGE